MIDNFQINIRKPAEIVGTKEHLYYILTEELNMKKLTARWVPRLLTYD